MTVFVYDNTKIDEFVTDDAGLITVGHGTITDYGDINQTAIIERDANYFNVDDWGEIRYIADIVPFGPINVVDGRDEFGRSRAQWIPENANTVLFDVNDSALTSPVRIWIGTGTIQEIGSGLERVVIPDLGAAGPVIFIPSGTGSESISKANYDGSGVIAKSGLSLDDLDQVYPYAASGTLTISGGTSTPYQDAYLPTIKNAAKIKGGNRRGYEVEKAIFNYSQTDDPFEKEDRGTVTVREGASFDNLGVTFDEVVTDINAKQRSFSDEDQVDYEQYGNIVDAATSFVDYGVIPQKLQGGIFFDEYQATSVGAQERRPFYFTGSGSIFKLAEAEETTTPHYTGTGTLGTFSGTNWFSQAPQSTIFGVGDKITVSGTATEAFTPATVDNAVLYDISGSGDESCTKETGASTSLVRLTGSVSDISLTLGSGDKSGTVLYNVGGGATKVATVKADGNINLFDITYGMTQEVPVFTPSWFSPMGDQITEELDWGLITATPTQTAEDWGPILTNDETIPKVAENWGYLLPDFNWMQLGGQHYPNLDSVSEGDTSLSRQTLGFTGIATFLLSEKLDVAAAISYESSGITGIATYKAGINIFGYNWFSQAPQHTVFGEGDYITLGDTGNESITPAPEIGSGSLFAVGGSAESSTKAYLQGAYKYINGVAYVTQSPAPKGSGIATFSQGRELGQTYHRIITHPEDYFTGTIFINGGVGEGASLTVWYNESSIKYGRENDDWGSITGQPAYSIDLTVTGSPLGGIGYIESFDDANFQFDQDLSFQNNGLLFDQDSGDISILPTFDKTDVYNVNFSTNNASRDWGKVGNNTIGGPSYDRFEYPYHTGFINQTGIDQGYEDYGWTNVSQIPEQTVFPFGEINAPQPIPRAKTMWIPKWNGRGSLYILGSGDERVAVASSTTSLFDFVSGAQERLIAQTPENTVLFDVSGITTYSRTRDFVGSGEIALTQTQAVGFTTYKRVIFPPASGITTISGTGIEKWSGDPPEGTYLHVFSGADVRPGISYAAQSTKAVMRIQGELNHPAIDYTPHYGIDRNVGIETGLFVLPGGGADRVTGITTSVFIPKYPGGQSLLDGKNGNTSEVITIGGRSISRTNAPISTHGVIYILGIGTAGNGVGGPDEKGDLDGVEFGATWRFTPATEYGMGSIMFDFTGTAPSREINVFGYYGDDRDPGTSGGFTVRQEGGVLTIESITIPEVGSGTYTFSGGVSDLAASVTEVGGGSLFAIGGISENTAAAELVAGTSIFNGTAEESFTTVPPDDNLGIGTAVLTLSGTGFAQRRFEYDGSGTFTFSNNISVVTGVRLTATGSGTLFGFGSAAESVPYQGFASSVLVDFAGAAETRYFQVFQDFVPSGTITLSGELTHPDIDYTPSERGGGFSTFFGSAETVTTPREVGVGTVTLSGTAIPRFTADSTDGTILYDLKGASAITKLHWLYSPTVSGITTISGVGITKPIQNFGYYGDDKDPGTSGGFTFSNTPLVHPFVDYTPSIGIGKAVLYNISGGSSERRAWAPIYGEGRFKGLASSTESYQRATFVGIGQISVTGLAPTEYLVFEEARTYLVII